MPEVPFWPPAEALHERTQTTDDAELRHLDAAQRTMSETNMNASVDGESTGTSN